MKIVTVWMTLSVAGGKSAKTVPALQRTVIVWMILSAGEGKSAKIVPV